MSMVRDLDVDRYPPHARADTLEVLELIRSAEPVHGELTVRQVNPDPVPLSPDAPALVGICGKPKAGKDVVADYLQSVYGQQVRRFAFSDAIVDEVNLWLSQQGLTHVIHEGNKSDVLYRRLLQKWGLGRRFEDGDYWARHVHGKAASLVGGGRMVIATGLRVPLDERTGTINVRDIQTITEIGGRVWRVDRPGNPYVADDAVEAGLDLVPDESFDAILINGVEGDLTAYHAQINALVGA